MSNKKDEFLSDRITGQGENFGYEVIGGGYCFEQGALAMKDEMFYFMIWILQNKKDPNTWLFGKKIEDFTKEDFNEIYKYWINGTK